MAKFWKFLESQANRLGVWVTAVSAMTALFGWIASHLVALRPYGWPEAFFVGLFTALALVLIISAGLVAWRLFRPLRVASQANSAITLGARDGPPDISTPELAHDLRAEISVLTDAIANIQKQIAVDLPNASTVVEAFHNLDGAVHMKVNRISEETGRFSDRLRGAELDLNHLLYWAVGCLSITILESLLKEWPKADGLAPPTDDDERKAVMGEIQAWLNRVLSNTSNTLYSREIYSTVINARHSGEGEVRRLPLSQRPNIDALAFADFYALVFQSNQTAAYLEYVIREIGRHETSTISQLHDRYLDRQKKP